MRVSAWTLNGIWSFVKLCLQSGGFVLKRVKDSSLLQTECFRSVTLLPGSEFWPVSFNKRQQNEEHFSRNIHGARMFPQCFPVSHTVNIVSSVRFCFPDVNYAYATRQGIWTKIRACEQFQKFCEHDASEHSSNFCDQFEQRPNFASIFKLDGTILYPFMTKALGVAAIDKRCSFWRFERLIRRKQETSQYYDLLRNNYSNSTMERIHVAFGGKFRSFYIKGALSREFCCFQLHSLLKSLPGTFTRSQNAQMD